MGIQDSDKDLLAFMLRARSQGGFEWLNDGLVRDILMFLLFSGSDTTGNLLTWVMYEVARDPRHLRAFRAEVDRELGTGFDDWESLTMDQLSRLTYLSSLIQETLRVHPSVPLNARTALEDIEIGGYHVPKGSTVMVGIMAMHRCVCNAFASWAPVAAPARAADPPIHPGPTPGPPVSPDTRG